MIEQLIEDIRTQSADYALDNLEALEKYRIQFLSRNGLMNELFEKFKTVPGEQKKQFGQVVNQLKTELQERFDQHKQLLEDASSSYSDSAWDFTLPVVPEQVGSRHPLTIVRERMLQIFERMSFNLSEGPEIEDDWHNFTALNFPLNHPAREMQDTFFVEKNPDVVLRTHTSSVQIRVMETQKPPIRTISPGRVYRNEAISARAHCMFHQIEGLYVNKEVSFADLKQTLFHFVREMFGQEVQIRFRPSFFPFTEPSAEIDISCLICKGDGCNVCKQSGWVEIGGAGMLDPNVLTNCGIDSIEYSGFAFGMGIERITMLKYQVRDLRLYTENDVRFLRQFKGM
jgi:phenylalanyl-tRNA synthetase alpha chain